ncbi:MAG: DNA translocase FtsK [Clostridia bacterium]|nr:DNA translocase FtsK [Clostridia bacterium]
MAKKRRYKKKKSTASKADITVVVLIILSILLAVLIYTKSGVIGAKLNEILGGMLGMVQYILPIGIFVIAIKLASEGSEMLYPKLMQYGILLVSLCIVFSVFQVSSGELANQKELSEVVKDAYSLGTASKGGGAIGSIGAVPLTKLLGNIGAIILCLGIAFVLVVFTFGINMAEIINKMVEKAEDNKELRLAHREELRKEMQKEERETPAERRRREKEERLAQKELAKQEKNAMDEQIKINFGGRFVDNTDEISGLKKYDHSQDDLEPLTKQSKLKAKEEKRKMKVPDFDEEIEERPEMQPDVIEGNLFKDVEEQKEEKTKAVLQLEHAMTVEDEHYEYPPLEILGKPSKKSLKGGAKALTDTATKLQKTLHSFGVSAKVENVSVGPAITRYELKPAEGVRVSKIANLADDIALNLAAETIRIEAPIPGKQAVGIEVPNAEREAVHLREVLDSDVFRDNESKLAIALGKDVAGNVQLADISKMPHILIAGSTGSGKSVCINTIITSIIYHAKPSEVKFVMVDPKVVELSVYNGIPHLLIPVVTDPRKAAGALAWAVQEMDNRYNLFAEKGVRDLKGYNKAIEKEEDLGQLPQIVIIVDELADLMMVAKNDVEDAICRLAQKARAAGMHLVIATQRPSVDVITGLIKANVPSRIAFAVSSQVDSRTILDSVGAEKLLGKGDMLYFPSGAPKPSRVQGAFVTDEEVEKIVDFVKSNGTATYSEDILESIENGNKTDKEIATESSEDDETDPFLMEAIQTVVETGQASTSFIQRRFKVGYARAGRIIDQMEERGVISGYQGSKPREVLMTKERWAELQMGTSEGTESGD